jgi:hypothetical protein
MLIRKIHINRIKTINKKREKNISSLSITTILLSISFYHIR